jgi:O-antigen/teichoic acid export membrane protein
MRVQILVTFLSRFGSAVAGFVIAILLSRFLGADGKGQASLLILNISFINLLTGVMGGSAMVFLAPRFSAFTLLLISYIWVPIATLLLWILYYFSGYSFVTLDANTFALAVLLGWFQTNSNFLLGKKQTHTFNILTLLQVFLTLSYLITAFYTNIAQNNFTQYIYALYIGYGLSFLASAYYTNKELNSYKIEPVRPILQKYIKHGGYLQLANLGQLLIYRTSYYIIDYYHNIERLGIYSNAIAIAESIWIVSRSISTIQYAEVANEKDINVSSQKTLRLRKINFGIAAALTFVVCILPDGLYTAIFGKDFKGLQQIIWLLAPGILAYSYTSITTHFFAGIGKNHYNTIISFSGFGITIIAGLLLIPSLSTTGAAITASVVYTLNAIQAQVMYKHLAKTF